MLVTRNAFGVSYTSEIKQPKFLESFGEIINQSSVITLNAADRQV